MIRITYQCSGCEASETVSARVDRDVVSTGHVIGGVVCDRVLTKRPTIEGVAPEGWMPFDPYTDCTYCPECWASIETPEDVADELRRTTHGG